MNSYVEDYINRRFSIIPLKPRSKQPTIRWSEYNERRASIAEWGQIAPHDCNIGIVTGPISGIVVLDVDGESGAEQLRKLGELPVTPRVRTGKGWHYYFRHPGTHLPSRTAVLPQVDLKADEGCVVAPPSVHESGCSYAWEIGLHEAPIAEMPPWLLSLVIRDRPRQQDNPSAKQMQDQVLSRADRSDIDNILGDLSQAEEGTRNDKLNKAAFALGQYVSAGLIGRSWAENKLILMGNAIGLETHEVIATIESGMSAGMKSPRASSDDVFEILDDIPQTIDRPLKLIDGQGLGVTWLPLAPRGDTQKASVELVIFREDGKFYSESDIAGSQPLQDLDYEIDLPFEVLPAKRLSPAGFKRFIANDRPDPANVFHRIVDSIDAFVSFEHSLESPQVVCELVACWTMGTYLTEAFDVLGYPWPNGERGSGKTQLLNTITSIAYLGKTVTAGSSFASLRDEAHYGATLGFDDCENVRDMDANKRELLLAGNTRGTVVTQKEPVGDSWRTRSINSFAPRLFTAIQLPDPVLDSRAIRLPMIASVDIQKTRRSPSRPQDWPHSLRELIDDLWIIGVIHLSRVGQLDPEAANKSPLIGRAHDIFRMPLAIAYWLEKDYAVEGLFSRVSRIAEAHQTSKLEGGGHDLTSLLIIAINELLGRSDETTIIVSTQEITNQLRAVATREEAIDDEIGLLKPDRVGRLLSGLGFKKSNSHHKGRSWMLSRATLERVAKSRGYELKSPPPTQADATVAQRSQGSNSDVLPF